MCQCPQRASTYFFENKMRAPTENEMCQCPQRASTYFFRNGYLFKFNIMKCQCPQRASTYFFDNQPAPAAKETSVNALNGLLLISS